MDEAGNNGQRDREASSSASLIGRVGAPRGAEATSEQFFFWVPDECLVEKTQLVCVDSPAGASTVKFYGLVTEVFRRSRRADMLEESDRFDGRPDEQVPVQSRGVTYAQVRVLAAQPNVFAPPREESLVNAAGEGEARVAYGVGDMELPLAIGMVRNGGDATAGPAYIDLDYLLGSLGGHMNVTGIAGVGTKSSFLTIVLRQLLRACEERAKANPADPAKLQVRPIILNVKGFDLFWLDQWSTNFTEDDLRAWKEIGWIDPSPFRAKFFAPQRPGSPNLAIPVGSRSDVHPYSWSLEDVLIRDLFTYLFSDSDRQDDNFALLVADIERLLVDERRGNDGIPERKLRAGSAITTFEELFDWFQDGLDGNGDAAFMTLASVHHAGTVRRFYRRLRRVVYESSGIFRMYAGESHPLDITGGGTDVGLPLVIDINGLADRHLQRFVVAALMKQAIDAQTGANAQAGMHYVFVLDELNRFAPRGHTDPITQLIETVAAELRSRGVILLGAQQQASLVSPRVVENAAVRVVGRTGGHELQADVFSFLPEELRQYVEQLASADKVVHQPSFREPMQVRVPRPP